MLNDIKLTSLGNTTIPNRDLASPSSTEEKQKKDAAAVTVNPHLGQLANTLTEEPNAERSVWIASLKHLIDNDSYDLNMSTLAKALAENPLVTKGL